MKNKEVSSLSKRVAEVFSDFFSKRSVNATARKKKFTKRKPKKLSGFDFLVALTLGRFKKSGQ